MTLGDYILNSKQEPLRERVYRASDIKVKTIHIEIINIYRAYSDINVKSMHIQIIKIFHIL